MTEDVCNIEVNYGVITLMITDGMNEILDSQPSHYRENWGNNKIDNHPADDDVALQLKIQELEDTTNLIETYMDQPNWSQCESPFAINQQIRSFAKYSWDG